MDNTFFAFLANKDVEYKRNLSLKELSSIKIGGNAEVVVFPDTIGKLTLLIRYLLSQNIKWKIVGKLTNLLPTDDIFSGIIISTIRLNKISISYNILTVESGATYSSLFFKALEAGLMWDVELFGIPGTIGGMIYSNAGAYGKEISDRIQSVSVFSPYENKIFSIDKSRLEFGYRSSPFQNSCDIILDVTFCLDELNDVDVYSKLAKIKEKRRLSQPLEFPSLGSVFKRHDGVSAGYYIDKAGLRGMRIGGAMISDKHAGFIINVGDATEKDFRELVGIIKETVYNKFKIMLEEEIEYM